MRAPSLCCNEEGASAAEIEAENRKIKDREMRNRSHFLFMFFCVIFVMDLINMVGIRFFIIIVIVLSVNIDVITIFINYLLKIVNVPSVKT